MGNNREDFMTRAWVVCLLAMLCCALWGSAFPCVKIGYAMFAVAATDTMSILYFAGTRFLLAGILVVVFGSIAGKKLLLPRGKTWWHVVLLCLLQTVLQYFFFYIGLAHTGGVKASIIEASNVFVAILVAALLFKMEKLTPGKIMGCVLGFAGVVLINLGQGGLGGGFSLTGEGFIFLSTVSYSFSAVVMKSFSKTENPVMLSGWQFVLGGAMLLLMGKLGGGEIAAFTPQSAGMLLYLACISAVAYSVWGVLLKHNPVSRVSVYGFMNPVFGVILSAILLREGAMASGAVSIISLVLVCVGIYVVNRKQGGEGAQQ